MMHYLVDVVEDITPDEFDHIGERLVGCLPPGVAVVSKEGWQPIETAPKDGRWIIVFGAVEDDCGEERRVAVAQWATIMNGRPAEGHWQLAWYDGGYNGWVDDVTNWMPLPAPPAD